MDMNDVYLGFIKRRFRYAMVCTDSFHVMKMMNDGLDRLRRKGDETDRGGQKGSEECHLLKRHRYVLFKEDLDEEYKCSGYFHYEMNDADYLNLILKIDPKLNRAYREIRRCHYFNRYWIDHPRDKVLEYIKRFIDDCFSSDIAELIDIASALDNWKEYIVNSFIPYARHNGKIARLSNGGIEGRNSCIKKMLKLVNG